MTREICGAAPTKAGGYCHNPAGRCRIHTEAPPLTTSPTILPSRDRDIRAIGWWLLDGLVAGTVDPRTASVLASVLRVMSSLGPDEMTREDQLKEVELRGLLMHGVPPRNEEEWERARRTFEPEFLDIIERKWGELPGTDYPTRWEPTSVREADPGWRPEPEAEGSGLGPRRPLS